MSYYLGVSIDPTELAELVKEGFSLGVKKTVTGSSVPVQWYSTPLVTAQYSISWSYDFGVFNTITAIEAGKVLDQTTVANAQLGNSYLYNKGFLGSDIPPVTATQIGVFHNAGDVGPLNFGVSQTVSIGGIPKKTPIAAAVIPVAGGSVVFEPTDNLTIYFTKAPGDGLVLAGPIANEYAFAVLPRVPHYLSYAGGKWTSSTTPPAGAPLAHSLAGPPTWYAKFGFVLAGPVDTSAFALWLENQVKHTVTNAQGPAIASNFPVEVISDKNRTDEILTLKGKWYETPLVIIPVSPGVENVEGRRVRILEVHPAITPFEELLKLLPSGSGHAAHSH